MSTSWSTSHRRRGITVLGLAILVIVIVIALIFLVRYLGQRPAATSSLVPRGLALETIRA